MKVLCSNLRHFYFLTCKASLKIKNPNHLASVRVEHHYVLQILFILDCELMYLYLRCWRDTFSM